MKTMKAGCYLVDKEKRTVALIYREKHDDWSFPKGHLESGETLKDCAKRETEEETKRVASIVDEVASVVEVYTTPKGEECECHMFVAFDGGKSDNDSWDTHETVFVPIPDVEQKLSYENLKESWRKVKADIEKLLEK